MDAIRLADFRDLARAKLDLMAFDYVEGGAHDEETLRRNEEAWRALWLAPHVLGDVAKCELATRFMHDAVTSPVGIAPTAFHGMLHVDAELATAAAAQQRGVAMIVSSLCNRPLEEIRRATNGPLWLQVYFSRDSGADRDMIDRATALGYSALVVTVDGPPAGVRERDVRNRFHLPSHLTLGNLPSQALRERSDGNSALVSFVTQHLKPTVTWEDIARLRDYTRLPLLLKGILRGDDALVAVRHGADGLIVSNHGGRQLDGAVSTACALQEVVAAVQPEYPIFVDGGIRRGTDVLRALALGARGVFVGRPILWGLAAAGSEGVAAVLALLERELELAMKLTGVRRITDAGRDLIRIG